MPDEIKEISPGSNKREHFVFAEDNQPMHLATRTTVAMVTGPVARDCQIKPTTPCDIRSFSKWAPLASNERFALRMRCCSPPLIMFHSDFFSSGLFVYLLFGKGVSYYPYTTTRAERKKLRFPHI